MVYYKIILLLFYTTVIYCSSDTEVRTEEDLGVKYANRCEVCKVLATELQGRLEETGKVHEVIEIGYSLDDVQPKKKTHYRKSELRLIESLDGVCEKILEYNIHKERQDSTRFAKGMSQTFKTLHSLVDKGVNVDLGIPFELWDKPSAEITHLKTQCESLLEENEDAIEDWYWNLQGTVDLKLHLCSQQALKDTDNSCLFEELNVDIDDNDKSELHYEKTKKENEFEDDDDEDHKSINKNKLRGEIGDDADKHINGENKKINKNKLKGDTGNDGDNNNINKETLKQESKEDSDSKNISNENEEDIKRPEILENLNENPEILETRGSKSILMKENDEL